MSGLKIAALYGFRPHMLGLCGPREARRQQLLKKFLLGKILPNKMRPVFKKFMGAYGYYKLIAKSNKIADPFNEKVVKAYWIGNKLLDKVKTGDLRRMVANEFSGPGLLPEKIAVQKAKAVAAGAKPHHSFHVLAIGSVSGSVNFTGNTKLKDICRISWGKVVGLSQNVIPVKTGIQTGSRVKPGMTNDIGKITVNYQPLTGTKKIAFGKPVKKEIFWDKNMIPNLKIGDWVAVHWDYAIQILSMSDINNLKKYTQNTINSLPS